MKYSNWIVAVGLVSVWASSSVEAKETRAYRCEAYCLLGSEDPRDLEVAPVRSRPFKSRDEAFSQLGRICTRRADGYYSIVAVTGSIEELEQYENEERYASRSYSVLSSDVWGWSYDAHWVERRSRSTYHHFRRADARVRVGEASAKTHCFSVRVEEDELDRGYEGTRRVGG